MQYVFCQQRLVWNPFIRHRRNFVSVPMIDLSQMHNATTKHANIFQRYTNPVHTTILQFFMYLYQWVPSTACCVGRRSPSTWLDDTLPDDTLMVNALYTLCLCEATCGQSNITDHTQYPFIPSCYDVFSLVFPTMSILFLDLYSLMLFASSLWIRNCVLMQPTDLNLLAVQHPNPLCHWAAPYYSHPAAWVYVKLALSWRTIDRTAEIAVDALTVSEQS